MCVREFVPAFIYIQMRPEKKDVDTWLGLRVIQQIYRWISYFVTILLCLREEEFKKLLFLHVSEILNKSIEPNAVHWEANEEGDKIAGIGMHFDERRFWYVLLKVTVTLLSPFLHWDLFNSANIETTLNF